MERDGLRSHLSGSVPISIAAHLVVLLLLLIVPLAADISLPVLQRDFPEFVRVAPPPPPPAFTPAVRHSVSSAPSPSPAAPTEAPTNSSRSRGSARPR